MIDAGVPFRRGDGLLACLIGAKTGTLPRPTLLTVNGPWMKMTEIDDFDLKILTLLQANGRLTNQELSDIVGLSASQCSRRRIGLEQAQLILGYHARLAPQAMNVEMVAMIEVRLVSHDLECSERFQALVVEEQGIIDAYKTTGDADYTLKTAVADLASLNRLMGRLFASHCVAHIKTAVVLERLKENSVVTI
jgi:DNA-binding Lrp family transcriptional regulator